VNRRRAMAMGLGLALALLACRPDEGAGGATPPGPPPSGAPPTRIVSLAPALTSLLFRLGLGPQVVGVTRYCDDPPEAATRPKIGGFADPDLEAILALKPDLIVGVESPPAAQVLARAAALGVRGLAVRQDSLAASFEAALRLGAATAREAEAAALVADARAALPGVAATAVGLRGRRALFVYGRGPLVVAGPGSFGDELLGLLGAVNVAGNARQAWPKWTAEELVRGAPEVILDASAAMGGAEPGFFERLPGLSGVRVEPVTHPGLLQPGPRSVEGLRALAARFVR
jgi:iron complex transport system substrate-binding protein